MIARIKGALDPFIIALMVTLGVASLLPARGAASGLVNFAAGAAIILLFFLHGARLSREAIVEGARNWRLHAAVLAVTFVLFPLLGIAVSAVPGLPYAAATGLLFLTLLPSTIQSSIAFTSIAGGNVAAAVCSASFSNLLGIFLTPLLAAALLGSQGAGVSWDSAERIALQLLAPFAAGHALRPVIGSWVVRHKAAVSCADRGSILLVVYSAFGAAVVGGLWRQMPLWLVAALMGLSLALLAVVMAATWVGSRLLGLAREDAVVLLFCGSKKSLATGVPMAGLLFPAAQAGAVILPVIIFHQIQLIVCAAIARALQQRLLRAV